MSIESQLERLNTNLEKMLETGISLNGAQTAPADTKAAAKTETKDADKPAATESKAADKPAASTRRTRKAADEEKSHPELTQDQVREVLAGFMGVDDADERAERKTFVAALLKKHKATKLPELDASKYAAVVDAVKAKQAELEEGGEEESDDDLL